MAKVQMYGFEDHHSRFEPKEKFTAREHHDWCVRMWRRMDRDGSGAITLDELNCEEFRSVLKKVIAPDRGSCMGGPLYARAQMNMDQAMLFFLRKADLNGDNTISFQEFRAFMKVLRTEHGGFHTADVIWALFDLDTDGLISESEFREIFRFYLGHDPTEEQFREEWGKLDGEGAGRVTKEQYITWLRLSSDPIFRSHAPELEPFEDDATSLTCSTVPADASRSQGQWRPWHSYTHFCWHEPSKGKPNHVKMKFRDTSRSTTSLQFGGSSSSTAGACPSLPRASSTAGRPEWNQRLATSHANWPDKNGKPRRCVTQRSFFLRPQSLPDLRRHLESKRGLRSHTEAIFAKEPPKRRPVLSSEEGGGASQMLSIASRGKSGGSMRHHISRERQPWNDAWYDPPQLKTMYHPAPVTNIGPPARHLYADLYDDEM